MRILSTTLRPMLCAAALGFLLTLGAPLQAQVTTTSATPSLPLASSFVAETDGGWLHNFLQKRSDAPAGSFDRQSVLTLLFTALAAIAVVRIAEHRNRPGQDR